MSPLHSGTYVPIALWVSIACPHCGGMRFTRRVGALIEPVFSDCGDFLGIIGALRFESCGHRVPGGYVEPVGLAHLMEDPDNVEVED
jgi:hypothetical protein